MNFEIYYQFLAEFHKEIIQRAKSHLKLEYIECNEKFFDKIFIRLSEEQKKFLNIKKIDEFMHVRIDPKDKTHYLGLRDLKYSLDYGNFYLGKSKIPAIMKSLSIMAASTNRYLSFLQYKSRNCINQILDILTCEKINIDGNEIIGVGNIGFKGKNPQNEFKIFFKLLGAFVSYYRTGYSFDKKNGYKHSAAFLECFHKKFHDNRIVKKNINTGLLETFFDGSYYKLGIKPNNKDLLTAWDYLIQKNTIHFKGDTYSGRNYILLGKFTLPIQMYKYFLFVYNDIIPNFDEKNFLFKDKYYWRYFLRENGLKSSSISLRKSMLKNLFLMNEYIQTCIPEKDLNHLSRNYPKHTDFYYKSSSGFFTFHQFAHYIAKMQENEIAIIGHIRRFRDSHKESISYLSGTEVVLFQMWIDYVSLIFGRNMKLGKQQMDDFLLQFQDFSLNPDSRYLRTPTKYMPPYPESSISIFSIHKDLLKEISSTRFIPQLFSTGIPSQGRYVKIKNLSFNITSKKKIEIGGNIVDKVISKIDSAPESLLLNSIFRQFCWQKTSDNEDSQVYEIKNELFIPIIQSFLGENELIGLKTFEEEHRPQIARRKPKSRYPSLNSLKNSILNRVKKVIHSEKIFNAKNIPRFKAITNYKDIIEEIVCLYKWPIYYKNVNIKDVSRASEIYSVIEKTNKDDYVSLRSGDSISHDFSLFGIFFEISELMQTKIHFGSPVSGLLYMGNKIYSVKISLSKGRPLIFIVSDNIIKKEYKNEFDALEMKVPIIEECDFLLWIKMIRVYNEKIQSCFFCHEEAKNFIQNLDWIELFNPKLRKIPYLDLSPEDFFKKYNNNDDFNRWKSSFLDYFFPDDENLKYCEQFMLFYHLGRLEYLPKTCRNEGFQKILCKYAKSYVNIQFSLINPSDRYVALSLKSKTFGKYIIKAGKMKILKRGEMKAGKYAFQLKIKNYVHWSKIGYVKHLRKLIYLSQTI